ncbi:DUF5817 domain-containing protein [Halegenticoccus tardaugens]|uniref:DUF5817 domain-containing protein n=1 Tax=Halegenticoccus tardaugens TaxID=2071624 RepID=UPI00100B985C|nr:DUF5817 domain-containing protein [Halegenticoccus tardaugens]
MYAVVGCTDCGNLWLLSDPGETARCSRCGKRHRTRKLRRFFESDDREQARQVRAAMLARKSGHGDAFSELDDVAAMEGRLDDVGVDDREFLEGAGLDADEVAAAGDVSGGRARGRREIVEDALREGDRPTEGEVVEYATERDVPADAARDLLAALVRRGEASESRGRYRLL